MAASITWDLIIGLTKIIGLIEKSDKYDGDKGGGLENLEIILEICRIWWS